MTLFQTVSTTVDNLLGRDTAIGIARAAAEAAERRQREADAASKQATAYQTAVDYLAQPRRTVEAIQAEIAAVQAEIQQAGQQIASIEAEIYAGDHEPSVKTATEHSRLQLTLRGLSGRLQRLQAEHAESVQAAIVEAYQAQIADELATIDELTDFEAGEWLNIQAAYVAAQQKRAALRSQLRLNQVTRRDVLQDRFGVANVNAVSDKLTAIDGAHPELHTLWGQV